MVLGFVQYKYEESVVDTPMCMAAVDCVWNAVVGHGQNEEYFLRAHGVFFMLDLLTECPKVPQQYPSSTLAVP